MSVPWRATAAVAAITAAAPAMSVFIPIIPVPLLRDSPPESNVMPLPTSASRPRRGPGGFQRSSTKRGGRAERRWGGLRLVRQVLVEAEQQAFRRGLRGDRRVETGPGGTGGATLAGDH